jgi:nucleotide-binding universal stress UspA family protein
MTFFDAKAKLLIDVELPDPDPVPSPLVDLTGALDVVLVGWYAVPEQTSPEQARDQFEDEARVALEAIADDFRAAGATVQSHLVFTGNELDTIERISAEQDCDAVLIPHSLAKLERILVPMRGLHNAPRIARFVAGLVQDGTTDVTLLHVLGEEEERGDVQHNVLDAVGRMMAEEGIGASLVRMRIEVADDPGTAIIDAARNYDAVVIGETEPSVADVIFGSVPEQIAREASIPVIVVRRRDNAS